MFDFKFYWQALKLGWKKETMRGAAFVITQEDIDAARSDAESSPERDAFADASVGDQFVIFSNIDNSTIVPREYFDKYYEPDTNPDLDFKTQLMRASGRDFTRFNFVKMK